MTENLFIFIIIYTIILFKCIIISASNMRLWLLYIDTMIHTTFDTTFKTDRYYHCRFHGKYTYKMQIYNNKIRKNIHIHIAVEAFNS